MATGDAAASAGLAVFAPSQDHGEGYDNDNVRGDELAEHIVNGSHAWSKITGKPDLATKAYADSVAGDAYDGAVQVSGNLQNIYESGASQVHADGVSQEAFLRTAAAGTRVPMYMDASLNIGKNTSSARYKELVADAGLGPAVLGLRPVTFVRRGDPEQYVELGLIAEEVADLGLELLVVRDAQGRPDGVRYDVLAVALIDVIGDMHRRITDLEAATAPTDPTPEA